MYVYDNISVSSPQNENYFRQNSRDIQNAHRAVYDILWKNMVELDRPQMTI
jgi:hypothetical protein